jgi:transcriptional regulator with XRE-family HTH domain
MLKQNLGRRIAQLRRARGLNQSALAKAVGCSVEFISLVERGINAPAVAKLPAFAQALKVSIPALFTFPTETKRPSPKRNPQLRQPA